jgi:8-oxo-dGTP pyrophosphatase MutT (NUDIX family)
MPISDYLLQLRQQIGSDLLLMPSVTVLVYDDRGRVLLVRNAETDLWMAPGGAIDPFESPTDAAVREAWEETGLWVEPVRILGVYGGGPEFHVTYGNGDQVSYVMTVFEGKVIAGEPHPDRSETSEVAFLSPADLAQMEVAPWVRTVVADALAGCREASFEPPNWRPPLETSTQSHRP